MLEKRKEESEAVGKYTQFLMTAVIGAFILFMAPHLVGFITGEDVVDDAGLFAPPGGDNTLAPEITNRVNEIFGFVMWVARIIVIFMIIIFVILLYVNPDSRNPTPADSKTRHRAAIT